MNSGFVAFLIFSMAGIIPGAGFAIALSRYIKAVARQPEAQSMLIGPLLLFYGAVELFMLAGIGLCVYLLGWAR